MKMMERFDAERGPAWLWPVCAGLLALSIALAFYLLWRTAVLAPFSDEFAWADRWYRLQADRQWAAYLLAPHNINRLAWTRLALALDMGALGGTNIPLILSGAVALAVMAAVLGRQAVHAAPHPVKPVAGTLAVMLTLTAGDVLDASTPIDVTYTHAAVFAVLTIVLSEGPGKGLGWRRIGALACAVAAAFGSGVGLALWPVMAWGAFRRRDWSWLAAVLVCGGVFVGLYMSGQGHGPGSAAAAAVNDPKSAMVLSLGFLSLPWTRIALPVAWIGGGAIALAVVATILIKGGARATPSQRVACGLMLFTLGAAAMAGLGRSGLEEPHNVPLRYGLLVAPMHVGVVMLAAPWLARLWRRDDRRLAQILTVLLLAGVFAQNAAIAGKVVEASDTIRTAIADFHAGRRTPQILTIVHPDPAYAEAISDRLARDDLFQRELHLKPAPPAR